MFHANRIRLASQVRHIATRTCGEVVADVQAILLRR